MVSPKVEVQDMLMATAAPDKVCCNDNKFHGSYKKERKKEVFPFQTSASFLKAPNSIFAKFVITLNRLNVRAIYEGCCFHPGFLKEVGLGDHTVQQFQVNVADERKHQRLVSS